MALQSADEILAEIPAPRKKFPKKKFVKPEIVVVCGSTSWNDRKKMKAALAKLDYKNVRYVVTGTSRGAELLCVSVAKELKLPLVQVHPPLHFGNNATNFRNNGVFNFFKPTKVIAFHKDIENSRSTALYLKLGRKKGIPCQLIDGKSVKKKKK